MKTTTMRKNKTDLAFPGVLRLEPSSACNLRCRHCVNRLNLCEKGIMSEKIFSAILERIKKYHFRVIVLYHGGEPLLNQNLYSMVERLKPLTDEFKIDTNGLLLERNIEPILASGIDRLYISLDGTSASENDAIRVGSDFKRISKSIKKLLKLKKKLGLLKPKVTISNVQIPDTKNPGEIKLPKFLKNEFGEFKDQIDWVLTWALIWPGLPFDVPVSKPEQNFCDNIVSTITVRWNGDVVPCCYDLTSKMVMGNVLKEDIEKIWNNAKYKKLRKLIHDFQPPVLCKNCPNICPNKVLERKYLTT